MAADDADARLDPHLRRSLTEALQRAGAEISVSTLLQSQAYDQLAYAAQEDEQIFHVLVKLSDPFFDATLHGLPVRTSTGTIVTVSATLPEILSLLENEDILYIESSRQVAPRLDVSVPWVYAEAASGGTSRRTGEGVIVGTVDTGIDYMHLDFRYDGTGDGVEESSRIVGLFDQTSGFLGVKYTQEDIESDLANGYGGNTGIVRQKDTDGHGTHVMGIVAGDGTSSTDGFVGMAPGAWIAVVKTTFYTSDILAGVRYIFDLAEEMGMPAVVNLSLGGHDGPHDGTSLFEQAITELSDGPGRVVVVSAGNEGDLSIHSSATLQGDTSSFGINASGWETDLVLWYPGSSRFTISVKPPSGPEIVAAWRTQTGAVLTPFGTIRIDNASSGANPNNGDHEVSIQLSGLLGTGAWQVTVTDAGSLGGTYHAWVVRGSSTLVGGDSSYTIDEPGNATGVITVGSFNTKATWASLAGEQDYLSQFPPGALSSFSSQGPTRDGRRKPEISAPGAWIGAALSRDAPWQSQWVTPDGVHTMLLGTSMAAPHVAGAVALMLSVNPALTVDQVRTLLTETATRDTVTGAVPNPRWGWGKLDVDAALSRVHTPPPVDPPPVDPPGPGSAPEIALQENPVSSVAVFLLDLPDIARWAELRVYTAAGERVFQSAVPPGSDRVEWGLVSSRGDRLPSGLYLYVLVSDVGVSRVGRLVIVP
jgi:subtilisin family serine protease